MRSNTVLGDKARLAVGVPVHPKWMDTTMFKDLGSALVNPITFITNLSASLGQFPNAWKPAILQNVVIHFPHVILGQLALSRQ